MPLTKKPNKKRKNISLTGNLKKILKENRKQILKIKNSKINEKKIKSKYKGGTPPALSSVVVPESAGGPTLYSIIKNEEYVEELNSKLSKKKTAFDSGIEQIKKKVEQVILDNVNKLSDQQSENSTTGETIPQLVQKNRTIKKDYTKTNY